MTKIIDYYLSKLCEETQLNGYFSLSKRKIEQKELNKEIQLGQHKFDKISYEKFLKVNDIFNKFLNQNLKCDQIGIMNKLYKMELTGALIYVNFVPCLVIEERKNSFIVIFKNDKIKILIKNTLIFYIEYKNIKYGFIGKNLKQNRFFKK